MVVTHWLQLSTSCPFYISEEPATTSLSCSTAPTPLNPTALEPEVIGLCWLLLLAEYNGSVTVELEWRVIETRRDKSERNVSMSVTQTIHVDSTTPLDTTKGSLLEVIETLRSRKTFQITNESPSESQGGYRSGVIMPMISADLCQQPICINENGNILQIQFLLNDRGLISCLGKYDPKYCTQIQATRFVDQFVHLVDQLQIPTLNVVNIEWLNRLDHNTIAHWNKHPPIPVSECFHDSFGYHAQNSPGSPAISAWDGYLTYSELDEMSSRVCSFLQKRGLTKGTMVPLLFEKSLWMVVSMLGVLKAGGICVCICASHTDKSIDVLLNQVEAKIILTSELQQGRLQRMQYQASIVDAKTTLSMVSVPLNIVDVQPEDVAFIVFSSGSTGLPKGIMIHHQAMATASYHAGLAMNVQSTSRILQFSSYAFDMSIIETWEALAQGGCLCIPSEEQRLNSLPAFMLEQNVTWAFMTPTTLRAYQPVDFPSLDNLVLGGESVPRDLVMIWKDAVRLFNLWGPAEVGTSGAGEIDAACWIPGTFGGARGCFVWIVRSDDCNQLAAVGAIGEVIVEGFVVTKGYLNDPVRTRKSFIPPPRWRSKFNVPIQGRFFRTNDLASYNSDGSIRYIGRKDTTVKINGQRVDTDAIEHHIRGFEPDKRVAVDAVALRDQPDHRVLIGFLEHSGGAAVDWQSSAERIPSIIGDHRRITGESHRLQLILSCELPRFMVPSFVILLQQFPHTRTEKTDKRRLRAFMEQFTRSELLQWLWGSTTEHDSSAIPQDKLTTANETVLTNAIADIFGAKADALDLNASFLQLGGDSIKAIQVIRVLSDKYDRSLRTETLLQSRVSLRNVAIEMNEDSSPAQQQYRSSDPFSLVRAHKEALLIEASQQCQIAKAEIEDIYPSTALQEGLLSQTIASGPSRVYVNQYVFTLPATSSIDDAKQAWSAVVEAVSTLRTRLIRLADGQTHQVVTFHNSPSWRCFESLAELKGADCRLKFGFGTPLLHLAEIRAKATSPAMLALTMHHALCDGWSLELCIRLAEKAYSQKPLCRYPFVDFMKYYVAQQHKNEAYLFWNQQIGNISATTFPMLPNASYCPQTSCILHSESPRSASFVPDKTVEVSNPTAKLRLAWALLLSMYTNSNEVVFDTVVDGRNAHTPNIEIVVGPTIVTLPVRVQIDRNSTVSDALSCIQDQMSRTFPYEHLDIRHIVRSFAPVGVAKISQCLLIVQPPHYQNLCSSVFGPLDGLAEGYKDIPGYGVILLCTPTANSWHFEFRVDEQLLPRSDAERFVLQLSHILIQLDNQDMRDTPLSQLNLLCSLDATKLEEWHCQIPYKADSCIHDIIGAQGAKNPEKIAICAWDGNFTYAELERYSSYLAAHIRATIECIDKKLIVPIFLERSRWVAVAILGIMKAGFAFVLLDESQNQERNIKICRTVQAQLILTSIKTLPLAAVLVNRTIIINNDLFSNIEVADHVNYRYRGVLPSDLLYIVFTSGSTGEPKGVLVEHHSYASAVAAQREKLNISPKSRVLQLASYSFDSFAVEFLTVLCSGGSVCVPPATQATNDIMTAVQELQANWLCITPSMLRLLDPDKVPSLRTIIVVGETMLAGQVATWAERVQLICGYGPSECCTGASAQAITTHNSNDLRNIGSGMGALLWVVDQYDHTKLVPIGTVGELVIQGPIVGRGYLNNPKQTASTFLEKASWHEQFPVAKRDRLYKTGDLVRYNLDGTCSFLGRKDQHTKLRGQRLDLAEVEHQARRAFPSESDIVATIVKPNGHSSQPMLAVVIQLAGKSKSATSITLQGKEFLIQQQSQEFKQQASRVRNLMMHNLPSIMVPAIFLQISRMPLLASGKANRRVVTDLLNRMNMEELLNLGQVNRRTDDADKLAIGEEVAWKFSHLLADILERKTGDTEWRKTIVGRNIQLSSLGLDSIDIMALSHNIAEHYDVRLTMPTLFQSSLTVRTAANLIRQDLSVGDGSHDHVPWLQDFRKLRAEIDNIPLPLIPPGREVARHSTCRVFLTGGTGFLGTELLRQLVQNSEVHSVTVLVRATDIDSAISRIVHSARTARWWQDNYRSVITAWVGDLSRPRLGLSDSQWKLLCGQADFTEGFKAIIHNGATVHWGLDYQSLEAVNVQSTLWLLKALSQNRPTVTFTYVSTLLVPSTTGPVAEAQVHALTNGYSQTKYASEVLIAAFSQDWGHQIKIVRPGAMIGPVNNGIANLDDFLWRVVATAVEVGAYNADEADSWYYVGTTAQVADMVINDTVNNMSSTMETINNLSIINIIAGLTMSDFWQAIMLGIGKDLAPVSASMWMSLVKKQTGRVGASHPLWPVIDFISMTNGALGDASPPLEGQNGIPKSMIGKAVARNAKHLFSFNSWASLHTKDFKIGRDLDRQIFHRASSRSLLA